MLINARVIKVNFCFLNGSVVDVFSYVYMLWICCHFAFIAELWLRGIGLVFVELSAKIHVNQLEIDSGVWILMSLSYRLRLTYRARPTSGMFSLRQIDWLIDWLIEHGLTSPPTQYRLSGRQFYRSKGPTNSIKVLKEHNNTHNTKIQ